MEEAVRRVNSFSSRWFERLSHGNQITSGIGAWTCLALALHGATGEAQLELEESLGVDKSVALRSAEFLRRRLEKAEGLSGAFGLWYNERDVAIRSEFLNSVRRGTVGAIPEDRSLLDRWAREHTNGLIEEFPVEIDQHALFLVASAVAAEAEWAEPFEDGSGLWQGCEEYFCWLTQSTADVDRAAILTHEENRFSRLVCPTTEDFDVHLLAGEENADLSAAVTAGIGALHQDAEIRLGSELATSESAGCLTVKRRMARTNESLLRCAVPRFDLDGTHDLLEDPGFFGLESATDVSQGNFDDIASDTPLAVSAAAQSAMASFTAEGFKAAAVTALEAWMSSSGEDPRKTKARLIEVNHDRPFAFIVVDRSTQLVLFAGSVVDLEAAGALSN